MPQCWSRTRLVCLITKGGDKLELRQWRPRALDVKVLLATAWYVASSCCFWSACIKKLRILVVTSFGQDRMALEIRGQEFHRILIIRPWYGGCFEDFEPWDADCQRTHSRGAPLQMLAAQGDQSLHSKSGRGVETMTWLSNGSLLGPVCQYPDHSFSEVLLECGHAKDSILTRGDRRATCQLESFDQELHCTCWGGVDGQGGIETAC